MTRLAANLTMMFTELPFLDRFDAAAGAGFKAVECVAPYVAPAAAVKERLQGLGLTMALFNMPPGDWAAGERGFGADPARKADFRNSIDLALEYADATGCRTLHLMAGKISAGAHRAAWTDTLIANVQLAADAVADRGLTIVLEPINTRVDMPGYFYDTTAAALSVMDQADRANVKLLYDIYHMQIMEGDVIATIQRHHQYIAHYHTAGVPGRHELDENQELFYPAIMRAVMDTGYQGYLGQEFIPRAKDPAEALAALRTGVEICDV